jgi:ABC-type Fe3+/spermidine/putrescine transport system ATPase subunit
MNSGRLEQAGTPEELYNFPRTAFAAGFTGPANFITLNARRCMIRPEWLGIGEGPGVLEFTGLVSGAEYYGRFTRLKVEPEGSVPGSFNNDGPLAVDISGDERFAAGSRVRVFAKTVREIAG